MAEFENHKDFIQELQDAQATELDMREQAREDEHFLHKIDGQWEPEVLNKMSGKPRYTIDKTGPFVDQVMGEMDQSEFQSTVTPATEGGSDETAKTFDGHIRNIEHISNARHVYSYSGRDMTESAISGWRIVRDYIDGDSFDTELLIKQIYNFKDSVWFDPNSKERTRIDANWCVVMSAITRDAYYNAYPDGDPKNVDQSRGVDVYSYKPEFVIIGELLYKKRFSRDLVLMSNNRVYADNEEFQQVRDELLQSGVREIDRRRRETTKVHQRYFDGGGWLTDNAETVYEYLPIIPCYANFKISEDKTIYRSAINRLKDPARITNYLVTRDVEEGALAPREKIPMTPEQMDGLESELSTINIDSSPILPYNHVDQHPPPYKLPGPQPNAGLLSTAAAMDQHFNSVQGMFAANMGDNPGLQSGVAIGQQIDRGNTGTYKYFSAMEIAIQHSNLVILKASPAVYKDRTIRTLGQDGSRDFVKLNDIIRDQQTGRAVEINNLSDGVYDVNCNVGPAFQNQQKETAQHIVELGAVDPTLIQDSSDVLLNNINAPGMEIVANRRRKKMLLIPGAIPDDEMTDEEKQYVQQKQQEAQQKAQQPGPQEQAMIALAQAEQKKAAAQEQDTISKKQEREANTQLKAVEAQRKMQELQLKAETEQQRINLQLQQQLADMQLTQEQVAKTQAETLNLIKQVFAPTADAVLEPNVIEAFAGQAEDIVETQEDKDNGTGPNPG